MTRTLRQLRPTRLLHGFVIAAILMACDPVGEAVVVVVDEGGAPLAQAQVTLTCPQRNKPSVEKASPDGRVVLQSIPDIEEACTFFVESAGFLPRTLKRDEMGYHKGIKKDAVPAKVVLKKIPTVKP